MTTTGETGYDFAPRRSRACVAHEPDHAWVPTTGIAGYNGVLAPCEHGLQPLVGHKYSAQNLQLQYQTEDENSNSLDTRINIVSRTTPIDRHFS